MSRQYRYSLEKGSKKHTCPNCAKKTFVRYVDGQTGLYLPETFGRCDRENKCGYHINPYKEGYKEESQMIRIPLKKAFPKETKQTEEPIFFDHETFKKTLSWYEHNNFLQNLLCRVPYPFTHDDITRTIELYYLGTVKDGCMSGSTTFPFIDKDGNVRAVQVKKFDRNNKTVATDFLHNTIRKDCIMQGITLPAWIKPYYAQDKKVSCLFGEHLLKKYKNNPVALVEAPKTAIYGTLYFGFPDNPESLLWLAVYNNSSFSIDKIAILKGRRVFVFPDLSKDGKIFKEWQGKAMDFQSQLKDIQFVFSEMLESSATEMDKEEGLDLADYLIKLDWRAFRKSKEKKENPAPIQKQDEASRPKEASYLFEKTAIIEPLPDWSREISALEKFFLKVETPDIPIVLKSGARVINPSLFVQSAIAVLRHNNGKKSFEPVLNELRELSYLIIDKIMPPIF